MREESSVQVNGSWRRKNLPRRPLLASDGVSCDVTVRWSGGEQTHLFPQPGMPTAWMMKITTWQKNTKKKKKKLTELSVLKKEENTGVTFGPRTTLTD